MNDVDSLHIFILKMLRSPCFAGWWTSEKGDLEVDVLSFKQAVEAGFEPREYDAVAHVGEITARLDFRMWGNSVNLRCFFTNLESGEKFSLSAFRTHRGELHHTLRESGKERSAYTPEDEAIDFAYGNYDGKLFRLVTRQGKRGGALWASAEMLSENAEGTM